MKVTLGCLGVLVAVFLLFVGVLFIAFRPGQMCENHLIQEDFSPNKELKTMIFSVDCVATTDFSTQISIVNSDYELEKSDKGNVFIADSDHGNANADGEIIQLKTKWIDDETL